MRFRSRQSKGEPPAGRTSLVLRRNASHDARQARAAFTLIELILVMTLLTVAISLTAPALANFFRGRSLDSEARHLLALTRQGQARAVSEGIPIELWVDAAQRTFGLEAEPSYQVNDSKAVELTLDSDTQVEIVNTSAGFRSAEHLLTSPAPAESLNPGPPLSNHPDLPRIRFLPDGSMSEGSPIALRLTGRDGVSLFVSQSRNRLCYEIRAQN